MYRDGAASRVHGSSNTLSGEKTLRILPHLVAVMRWLSGRLPAPPEKPPLGIPSHLLLLIPREQRAEARRQRAKPSRAEPIRGSPQTAA